MLTYLNRYRFIFFLSLFILTGCFDIYTPTKNIPGPYYLSEREDGSEWALYYDLNDGAGIGRVHNVNKIGWTENYIFVESMDNYFFLDKTKDKDVFNSDEIVVGPFRHDRFSLMLDSLGIKDFVFQINLDK